MRGNEICVEGCESERDYVGVCQKGIVDEIGLIYQIGRERIERLMREGVGKKQREKERRREREKVLINES